MKRSTHTHTDADTQTSNDERAKIYIETERLILQISVFINKNF